MRLYLNLIFFSPVFYIISIILGTLCNGIWNNYLNKGLNIFIFIFLEKDIYNIQ